MVAQPPDDGQQEGAASLVAHACAYAQRGWHIFPLRPDDKRPAVSDWENRATADLDRVQAAWAGPYARSGIGIACGPSRLVVVDLDTAKGDTPPEAWQLPGIVDGSDVLAALYERHGDRFPFGTTPIVRTASGGLHLYFTAPAGREVRNSASKVGWKVDVRAAGGYVVAPPSTAAGQPYTWETTPAVSPAQLPAWLLDRALPPKPQTPPQRPAAARPGDLRHSFWTGAAAGGRQGGSLGAVLGFVLDAQQGERNHRLYWAACRAYEAVREGRADHAAATAALIAAGQRIGLTEREATQTVESAQDAPPPRTGATA